MFLLVKSSGEQVKMLREIALKMQELSPFVNKQALRNSCELLRQGKEPHTSSFNCMQAHETVCKLIELNVSSWNFM